MHLLLPAKDLWLLDLCLRSGKVTGLLGRRFCLSCPVGWLRHAWGSCIIHCNQVEKGTHGVGRFRHEFLKRRLEKWTVFARWFEGTFKKDRDFFELKTLDTQPVSRKNGIDLKFAFTKKAQENHQRKESWGPNSCIIFHTTKWCDLFFSSRSPSHSAEAPSNP